MTPKRLNLFVTREDIRLGRRARCGECPIARAFLRRTGASKAYVDFDQIYVTRDGWHPAPGARRYRVTRDIEVFMSRFDKGKPVHPFRPVLEGV